MQVQTSSAVRAQQRPAPGRELYRALADLSWDEHAKRRALIAATPEPDRKLHARWLHNQLRSVFDRFGDLEHQDRGESTYNAAYAYYKQTRDLLGVRRMKATVWDHIRDAGYEHWAWFAQWRRARYRASPKGKAAQAKRQARYAASEKGKAARRRYRESQAKGFTRTLTEQVLSELVP